MLLIGLIVSSLRCLQAAISVVLLMTGKQRQLDNADITRHHHQLQRLACDNGGLLVHWPADKLTAILDRHEAGHRRWPGDVEVHWTLPYVSAATRRQSQSQPVISASLPVYSNHSHTSVLQHVDNPLTPIANMAVSGTAIKHPVPDRVKPSFVIFDIRAL